MMRMMIASAWRRDAAALILATLLGTAAGCDSRGLVPVAGRITFAGQQPPASGYVFFVPVEAPAKGDGHGPRSGTALFMPDGTFTVATFKEGDGLRPGTYEARVQCSKPRQAGMAEGDGGSAVPAGFKPPEVTVPASGPRPFRVEIDVR
jgi:hypothetical protein